MTIRVDPMSIHGRPSDEMPTRIHISAADVAKQTGAASTGRRPSPAMSTPTKM
jgi:hypothetical protein